jgi:aerobic-type carbon monoxide dehydrogenase small subunit (CoxS/CutS family)
VQGSLKVNGQSVAVDAPDDTPLLWVLRDFIGLTGTKFGCGMALCGACTVHVDGKPIRSCLMPWTAVKGRAVTTVEGRRCDAGGRRRSRRPGSTSKWSSAAIASQGQIMSAAALLANNPKPSDADIDAAMAGNICRCGTYGRIRAAIHRAAGTPT